MLNCCSTIELNSAGVQGEFGEFLGLTFAGMPEECRLYSDPLEVFSGLSENARGVALVSASLPGVTCDEYIKILLKEFPEIAVIVISDTISMDHAVSAISAGAAEYLVMPVDRGVLREKVLRLLQAPNDNGVVARAPATRQAVQLARRVAVTGAGVLITGESGTGKEVFARYIHQYSNRSAQPFVAVNCAAIPETMLESILFGHEKGAFTGASARHSGKFEKASGGTLFLDEVAEMPLEQQAKLLRVLQEKEVERLGGAAPLSVDVRVIAATNRDLAGQVSAGKFREDLFYRLNVFPLHLEPLRNRREDILPLAKLMTKKVSVDTGQPELEISPGAAKILQEYHWPGNVRELDNVIQRACVLRRGWIILPEDLMLPGTCAVAAFNGRAGMHPDASNNTVDPVVVELDADLGALPGSSRKHREWQHLISVLQRNKGQRNKTAEELGMTTRMLRYKLAQLREAGVDVDDLIKNRAMAS